MEFDKRWPILVKALTGGTTDCNKDKVTEKMVGIWYSTGNNGLFEYGLRE